MAPKNLKDKGQIGRFGEAGLFLVSDRTLPWEWESLARRELCQERALQGDGAVGATQADKSSVQTVSRISCWHD
jgi:hypothetical protein